MDSLYKPAGRRGTLAAHVGGGRPLQRRSRSDRESFAIAHPPPNVTGDLHLGHALQLSLADTIVRTRRMQGYNVLFQPGFDHAGIATQKASRSISRAGEDASRPRPRGIRGALWDWLREYGGKIMFQFRRIGASLDYRRERFTMDDAYVRAVMRFFVHLYPQGLDLPREPNHQLVPVSTSPRSPISRSRTSRSTTRSRTCAIRSPTATGTYDRDVRPATIVADVAVAVHPGGRPLPRLVGRDVIVPFVERRVPVIADERVERDFGTGALKITPGHDPSTTRSGATTVARDHRDRA